MIGNFYVYTYLHVFVLNEDLEYKGMVLLK